VINFTKYGEVDGVPPKADKLQHHTFLYGFQF